MGVSTADDVANDAVVTVADCLAAGYATSADVDAALRYLLVNSDPILVAPGIFACLPLLDELPKHLRLALAEIALLART